MHSTTRDATMQVVSHLERQTKRKAHGARFRS
jgi:hypothetical protein